MFIEWLRENDHKYNGPLTETFPTTFQYNDDVLIMSKCFEYPFYLTNITLWKGKQTKLTMSIWFMRVNPSGLFYFVQKLQFFLFIYKFTNSDTINAWLCIKSSIWHDRMARFCLITCTYCSVNYSINSDLARSLCSPTENRRLNLLPSEEYNLCRA